MESYYYLFTNLLAISIPLALSFSFRGRFIQHWRAIITAIGIMAVFFISWDIPFEHLGVWGFNDRYLLGPRLFGLPLEEYLFFICIPYACLFTYDQLRIRLAHRLTGPFGLYLQYLLPLLLLGIAFVHREELYTLVVCLSSVFLIVLFQYLDRKRGIHPAYYNTFWLSYLIIVIPFVLTNGVLTGAITPEPIVWYNDEEHLGPRLGTIPYNDFIYYYLIFLMIVCVYEYTRGRSGETP